MFFKTVIAYFNIEGVEQQIKIEIPVCCLPTTPDEELIRRAGNILKCSLDSANYKVR
jgi:hypothetical protein